MEIADFSIVFGFQCFGNLAGIQQTILFQHLQYTRADLNGDNLGSNRDALEISDGLKRDPHMLLKRVMRQPNRCM